MFRYTTPFLLSSQGSIRATSYAFSNKSVTLAGRSHVVWLDRPAFVRGRTYDHATQAWGPTIDIMEGSDNHTSPALIADSFGDPHLRIALGPHGAGWNAGQFKWAISDQPGRIDGWKWHNSFGYAGTYPCLIHTPQGLDAIVYRGGEWPSSVMFQRQIKSMRQWTKAREILWQDVPPQYTHYGAYIDCDAQGVLYVAAHFYTEPGQTNPEDAQNFSRGVAIIKSSDLGDTWTTMAGEPVKTPALYHDRLALPANGEPNMNVGGLAIDSRGRAWAVTFNAGPRIRGVFVSCWTDGRWETHDAGECLPPQWMVVDTAFTIDSKDRLHLAVTALRPEALEDKRALTWWGHRSCEVFHVASADGGRTWHGRQISAPDDRHPNWLPTISKNSLFHRVDKPVILYTHGPAGANFTPGVATPVEPVTEVYAVIAEEA